MEILVISLAILFSLSAAAIGWLSFRALRLMYKRRYESNLRTHVKEHSSVKSNDKDQHAFSISIAAASIGDSLHIPQKKFPFPEQNLPLPTYQEIVKNWKVDPNPEVPPRYGFII
uniref:COesterase domain-containing protein n=1 Tax=Steinernema glaseri TaxID=37863 RepID=A0A1I7Z0Y1_9BILA